MIIGTAGHIDHGKTTLVRALTGVDTDRLPEEKRRGISIELGYAYLPLPDAPQEVLGIIDVPGHEKFIHTMAAGAVGIDHVLLVVAADDGVMPQTREHVAIALLLGVRRGTVVLTKADRATPQRQAEVCAEIRALLNGTPLAAAPLFSAQATAPGDAGVAAVRTHLFAMAREQPARRDDGLFRLAVDRVFTLPGQGTVVTGTVFQGQAHAGDVQRHSASGTPVRLRSIHAQNRASAVGRAGQRVALNLAGIEREAIARGDWIADPLVLQPTRRIDVRVHLLDDAPPLSQWATVHAHLGTAHHVAHVALLENEPLAPGGSARLQLVFDTDVFAIAGDRLLLRNAQASRTLGGGPVLDPYAPERKRRSAERMAFLDALESVLDGGPLAPFIALAAHGLGRHQLARLLGRAPAMLEWPSHLVTLPLAGGDALLLAPEHWHRLQAQVLDALTRFHERTPDEPGLNAARLRRMALPGLTQARHDALWHGLLAALLEQGEIVQQAAWLHRPGHSVQLSAAEQAMAAQWLPAIDAGAFDPPWVRDLARTHHVPEEVVRQLLRKLARQGRLFQVVKDLFYSNATIARLAAQVAALAGEAPAGAVPAAAFRDATGLGRKRAIQVLEFFDRAGYTRRVRDAHLLRPESGWSATP